MIQRAVIYLRVSTEDQTRGMSLESQEAICRAYCEREHITIDRVFVDRGVSAKTDLRAEFQAMISYCRASCGRITHAVIYKLDRFSREARHTLVYRAMLTAAGCRLVSATENLSDDPAGKLLGTILAGIAEFDNDAKSERVKANMRALLEAGYWTHQPPFGYAIARENDRPVLVPNAVTGPIVRKVFRQIANRTWTPAEAREHLDQAGCRISNAQFYKLIRSSVYAGLITSSLIEHPAKMRGEPLVDLDTFMAAGDVLGRSTRRMHDGAAFPLRGVLICPTCAIRLTASTSRGRTKAYGYYHCKHGHVRVGQAQANAAFCEALDEVGRLFTPLLSMLKAYVLQAWEDEETEARDAVKSATAQAARIASKRKRLLDAMLDGTIDQESYRAADSDLRAQHHSADGVMVASHMTRYEARSIIEGSEQILASLSAMWNRMDGQQRRAFAAVLYPDGLVWSTDLVRTGASGSLFEKLRGLSAPELSLASPTGCNPNLFVIYDLLNSFKPLLGFAA